MIEQGETIELEEKSIVKSTAETRIFWSVKKPMRDDQGRIIGLCGICTDITERKAMEDALRKSEKHLRLSQSHGGIGTWEADLVTHKQTWSEGCIAILGFPDISDPKWEDFLSLIYPDDRQQVIDATQSHIERDTPYDVEFRTITADGNIRWLRYVGHVERDDKGKPIIMRGTGQDVTERHQNQQQIEKSLSLLSATLESCNDAILVVDMETMWVLHNQRFIDLWHIPKEIIGAKDDNKALAYVLKQLIDPDEFLHKVRALYQSPEASSFDKIKFKDGKIIERYSIPQCIDGKVVGRVWSFRDVTEREHAEKALKKEAEKNLALLRNASDGIHIVDSTGRIIEVSDSFCAMLGYQREEMIGMHVSRWDALLPDNQIMRNIEQRLAEQGNYQFQTLHRRKDGSIFDVEISSFPCKLDGAPVLYYSSRDITERKRVEDSLIKTRAQLKTFINQAPVSMAMFDRDMNYLAISGRWLKEHGRGYADLIGCHHYHVHPDLPEEWKAIHRQGLSGVTSKNDEDLWIQADGSKHWLRWAVVPWTDEYGAVGGIIISTEDITTQKHALTKLTEQAQQLRETSLRKDRFLAMLAHELRNPLAPIYNAVQILKFSDSDPVRIAWCSNIINRQVEHLVRLVDDLLDISRISRNLIELKKEPLAVQDFIQSAVETCQPLIDDRRQKFSMALPLEPLWVKGDRIRLAQVVANLINNAAKYTQEGGCIDLSIESSAELISIRVSDNGCGIDSTDLSNLFELFYQADRTLDRAQGGLGIGLSLVHSLVGKHGGEVKAYSAGHGQGSELVVRLPRLIAPQPGPVFDSALKIPMHKELRILVVDDNRDAAMSLSLLLEIDGHKTLQAYDGKDALEMAWAERPDVILLDIGLPEMNGYEVARVLRLSSEMRRTLLIALTGYGQPEDRSKSRTAGFDEHLVKPVEIEKLRKLLADHQALLR